MTDANLPLPLPDRVTELERRLGRLRWICWVSLGLAAAAVAWGLRPEPGGIREGRLWLARDETGRVRGMFGVTNDGVALTMYDSTGQLRLDVGLAPSGAPGVLMRSKQGDAVVTLNATDGSPPTLRFTNVAEKTRLEITPRPGAAVVETSGANRSDTLTARRP